MHFEDHAFCSPTREVYSAIYKIYIFVLIRTASITTIIVITMMMIIILILIIIIITIII